MPFTISHVAAVLPFSRPLVRWRLLSATIIGSMVPDFGFFMPWRPARMETHSVHALITFCLPVGLATYWIFQGLIKPAVTQMLPSAAYARWRQFTGPADIRSAVQWALAAGGILVGAVTHLAWDAFTHEGARGVRMIPMLDDPFLEIAGRQILGTRFLQDLSSLIGLALVLGVVIYGLRPGTMGEARLPRELAAPERHAWIAAYALMWAVLSGLFLVIRLPHFQTGGSLSLLVANYAIAVLRGFAAALVVVSLALTLRLRTKR